ncbi:MAG: FGGY family carbohydrate kinase [Gemmatimonadota bacterium]|nr:FGGY family carbohydrate kinase [Gemmatimonadota bacterium]
MGERLFAGLDVSTQSCKLVVIDLDAGAVVHVDRVAYDDDLPSYGTRDGVIADAPEGVSESEPGMWIEAVELVLGRLDSSPIAQDRVRAIAVSGQQHGLVAIDGEGRLARRTAKLWNDYSTVEECEILTEEVGGLAAMIAEVGNSQRPGYTAGKIFHMARHEPEAYAAAETLFVVKDYINWWLTGGPAGGVRILEPGDTSGTALWNPATGRWSERVMKAIDPGLATKLPEVGVSDRPIGRLSEGLATTFEMSPDCLIAPGSGDNMCAAIGTGNVVGGLVTVSLGTSGTACTVLDEPFVDPLGEIASYRDALGGYLPLLCVSNLANGYNEFLRLHGFDHADFTALVEGTPPGNHGRILVPWFGGERTPDVPRGAPAWFGFGLGDFTPPTLARAVLEGHVLNLQAGFERMPIDCTGGEIRLTGGLSQSDAWCRTIANVFDAEVVPVRGEGAALGAALSAAWVWLREQRTPVPITELVEPFVELDEARRARPDGEHRETSRRLRELFAALTARLRGEPGADPFELRAALVAAASAR